MFSVCFFSTRCRPRLAVTLALAAATALSLGAPLCAHADDGDPDPTFSGDGIAYASWTGGSIEEVRLALGPGDAIYVGGTLNRSNSDDFDFAIAKLHADGSPDTNFGSIGYRTVGFDYVADGHDSLREIFPLALGKLMLLGNAEVAGEIVAQAPPAMTRLTASGDVDTAFANAGRQVFPVSTSPWPNAGLYMSAAADQADGKFLFGGYCTNCPDTYRAVVLRVNGDGTPDATFGTSGWSSQPLPLQPRLDLMQVDAQGRIVLAGAVLDGGSATPLVVRLTPSGALDPTFGGGAGYLRISQLPDTANGGWSATALALLNDGSVVLAVSNYIPITVDRTGLVHVDAAGSFDADFGVVGLVNLTLEQGSRIQALALQSGGRILASGWISHTGGGLDFLVARTRADGSLDPSFDNNGLLRANLATGGADQAQAMTLTADGRPLIAGYAQINGISAGLLRLTSELIFADGFE